MTLSISTALSTCRGEGRLDTTSTAKEITSPTLDSAAPLPSAMVTAPCLDGLVGQYVLGHWLVHLVQALLSECMAQAYKAASAFASQCGVA